MANIAITDSKPADAQNSRQIASAVPDLEKVLNELFNDPESGAYVQGVVVSVEEPTERSGTNEKGRPYRFINRRIQLQTRLGAVICAETHDNMNEFKPLSLYSRVKWVIQRARMDGSQMVFSVVV